MQFLRGRCLKSGFAGAWLLEIFELGALPLEPHFSLSSFPQIQTASLRGRTGLQCDTESKTSEGSRRNA